MENSTNNAMCRCENCGKKFNFPDGIMAEIKNGCVVAESCSPSTKITELCNQCVDELNIKLY